MFKELMPLLRHRALAMTVTSVGEDKIRVNIVPKQLKDDENKALTTPLSITDTAEELDAQLGATLVEFVGAHLQLKNTLQQAKTEMEAAAKEAQAEARAKQKNGKKDAATATPKPIQQPVQPTEPVAPPPPRTASLFDMSAPQSTAVSVPAAPTECAAAPSPRAREGNAEEAEILEEIREEDSEEPFEEAA